MNNLIICWHCKNSIETKDAYCRYCGKGQGQHVPFRYTHVGIILLSLLLGPLTLPFIWKSPKISKTSRVGYVLLNLLITSFMLILLFDMFRSINHQVKETMKIIEQTDVEIDKIQ